MTQATNGGDDLTGSKRLDATPTPESSMYFQEEIESQQKTVDDIAAVLLNSRKVHLANNELGFVAQTKAISNAALRNNMRFEIMNKDSNGRSIIHRAAFDQLSNQMNDVLSALNNLDSQSHQQQIEERDKYGNTALLLACIRRYEEPQKQQNQYQVVKELITIGKADPNVSNPHTLFTPLHWAAVHGANDIVNILLQYGAKAYMPDKKGHFPLDYAGLFKHQMTVSILLKHSLNQVKQVEKKRNERLKDAIIRVPPIGNGRGTRPNDNAQQQASSQRVQLDNDKARIILNTFWIEFQSGMDIEQNEQQSPKLPRDIQEAKGQILIFSPVLHTSMLYWAAMFDSISVQLMQRIMKELEAYPEAPVAMHAWRTPCHAAAQVGNSLKLKELMVDINRRYVTNLALNQSSSTTQLNDEETGLMISLTDQFKKRNIFPFFEKTAANSDLLKQRRFLKFRLFNDNVFQTKLEEYKNEALVHKFDFNFLDIKLNSPVHIASQYGQSQCIEVVLVDYNCPYDQRNIDGWMAKDIVQHDDIRDVFRAHYKRVERRLRQAEMSALKESGVAVNSGQIARVVPVAVQDQQPQNERERLNRELLMCREHMPFVPPLVLQVKLPKANQSNTEIVNNMIELLTISKFTVQMFPSMDQDIYYIALKLDQKELENEAKYIEMKIKMCDIETKRIFDPLNKGLFEPFRSKDIQYIMLSKLQRIVNMESLRKKEIILDVISMHDMFGLHEIKARWFRNTEDPNQGVRRGKCQWLKMPMPLPLITQFFKESMSLQFSELSTIKNYYGEKVGFYYAWMSYYTAWLMIPAIGGLALTIYQIVIADVDTIFTTLYALLVSIWVTIFIERWKRKSAEISLKWGVSHLLLQTTSESRVMREEFQGYEYFSHITFNTQKRNYQGKLSVLYMILSILIQLLLIGACVGTFFGQQQMNHYASGNLFFEKYKSVIIGVVNGIIISVINALYAMIATYFVNMENHKYRDSYEKSYVFKIFIFKFINTNLSIFYAAFSSRDFSQLYYLILGMTVTKVIQIFLIKNFQKLAMFWFYKFMYFRKVKAAAVRRHMQHQSFMQELSVRRQMTGGQGGGPGVVADGTNSNIEQMRMNEMKKQAIFRDLDTQKYPVYQRIVFNANKNIDPQALLIDYVELNQLMPDQSELLVIYETSDVFILFGLATLYSCACPIVPLIAMLHNIVDINMSLYTGYTTIRRPLAQLATNIHPWLAIAEFMAIAAVISNCLLLYFSTPVLTKWVLSQSDDRYDDTTILWILVGVEHGIVIIKQLFAALILDVPGWVEKSQQRVEREEQSLAEIQQDREQHEMVRAISLKLTEQNDKRTKQLQEFGQIIGQLERKIQTKDQVIVQLQKDGVPRQQEATNQVVVKKVLDQSPQKKKAQDMSLVDFLGIVPNEWLAKSRTNELEKALNRNMQKRLMLQTFTEVEKEILIRRLGQIQDSKSSAATSLLTGGLQVLCYSCHQQAIVECLDCVDYFCKACKDQVHQDMTLLLGISATQQHRVIDLNLQINSQTSDSKISKWVKFEQYNFPVLADNDQHAQLQHHFYYLKRQYFEMNYLDSEQADKIHLQSLFVDQQYELLTDLQGKALMTKDKRLFGDHSVGSGELTNAQRDAIDAKRAFNDEELYYMNKVAHHIFSIKAQSATFLQFVKILGILQSGPFLQRCTIWLQLIQGEHTPKEQDPLMQSQNLTHSQLEEGLRFAYVQKRPQQGFKGLQTTGQILQWIFKNSSPPKEPTTSSLPPIDQKAQQVPQISLTGHLKKVSMNQMLELISKNEEIRDFMACVVQFRQTAPVIPFKSSK